MDTRLPGYYYISYGKLCSDNLLKFFGGGGIIKNTHFEGDNVTVVYHKHYSARKEIMLMRKQTKRRMLARLMSLVMVLSLFAGVGIMKEEKVAKADGDPDPRVAANTINSSWPSDHLVNPGWDVFLSESDETAAISAAERQFGSNDAEDALYRGEINGRVDSSLTYYVHYYSNNGCDFDSGVNLWAHPTDEDGNVTNDSVNAAVTFGNKEAAADNTTDDSGVRHFVRQVVITPAADTPESFVLGFTDSDNNKCWLARVNLRQPDPLWVSSSGMGDLASRTDDHGRSVGEELYKAADDGNHYLGKVYYYSSSVMYPNVTYDQVIDQNNGDWTSTEDADVGWTYRGLYDNDGNPIGSHIFVQYYHLNNLGGVLTEDNPSRAVSYLVYDENPENTSAGATIPSAFEAKGCGGFVNSCEWTDIQGDGSEILAPGEYHANVSRTFAGDYYAIWGVYGTVTVNGNITGDCTLGREFRSEEKYDSSLGSDVRVFVHPTETYIDEHGNERPKPLEDMGLSRTEALANRAYSDEAFSNDPNSLPLNTASYTGASLTVNGNCGFISLTNTYEGSCTIASGKSVDGMGLIDYANAAFRPDEAGFEFYGSYVGTGNSIITGGHFISSITPLDEGVWLTHYVYGASEDATLSDVGNFNGYSVIMGDTRNGEPVAGTSSAVDTFGAGASDVPDAVDINVSESVGPEVFPMVRRKKATDGSWKDPNAWWTAIQGCMPSITKATIMDIALVQDNTQMVEPASSVNLYMDGLSSWSSGCALYHVREDGRIEKLSSSGASGRIDASTDGFSTYFVAENADVPTAIDPTLANLASTQRAEDNPIVLEPSYSGGGSGGGGGGGTVTPKPTKEPEVTVTTNPDGSKTTTTVTEQTDGTKVTEKETVKTDGTKITEKETVKTDGTKVTEKETVKTDGTKTTEIETVKANGTTIKSNEVVNANGDSKKTTVTTKSEGATTIQTETKKDSVTTKATYEVKGKGTVVLKSATTTSKSGTVTIPKTVTADGKTYKVVVLKKNMLKGSKTKPKVVKLKNAADLKKVERGAFNGLNKKGKILINASKSVYKNIVKAIKASGVPASVKFKRV